MHTEKTIYSIVLFWSSIIKCVENYVLGTPQLMFNVWILVCTLPLTKWARENTKQALRNRDVSAEGSTTRRTEKVSCNPFYSQRGSRSLLVTVLEVPRTQEFPVLEFSLLSSWSHTKSSRFQSTVQILI